MSYKIADDHHEQVEVREIALGRYFEFHDEVYQRFAVDSNFALSIKTQKDSFIFAVNLTTGRICGFSTEGKAMVTPLHETSPVVLTRTRTKP